MLPDRVSNPGPLTYESGALPIALRGPAIILRLQYRRIFNLQVFEHVSLSIIDKLFTRVIQDPRHMRYCKY